MLVQSLALRTELAIAAMRGQVTDRGEYIVVETADEPGWDDGNYLALPASAAGGDVTAWVDRFTAELGAWRAVALRWDDPTGTAGDGDALSAAGFTVDRFELLAADEVLAPPHELAVTELSSDGIAASADLAWTLADRHDEGYRQFLRRRATWQSRLVAAGQAKFFGAFDAGQLVASVGLIELGPQLARYQDVQTAPAYRRRGLAGALLATAARDALGRGTRRFTILAEPASAAARVYQRVGFASIERVVTARRIPPR